MKFAVYGKVVGTKFLGLFEAESEEEVKNKVWASDRTHISLCHHCADECEDPEVSEIIVEEA